MDIKIGRQYKTNIRQHCQTDNSQWKTNNGKLLGDNGKSILDKRKPTMESGNWHCNMERKKLIKKNVGQWKKTFDNEKVKLLLEKNNIIL